MGRCCRHHSLWCFGSGFLGNTRGRPVVWNVEPGRRGGSGRRPYGTNERNGGDPRENQGIGCSVDEPGRPRVRLPPLRRWDLRREPQESRKGDPTRLLENSTVCEKPVLHDPVNGSGTAGTSPRCTTATTVLGTSGRTRMSQQRHRVGPWCRPSSPSSLGEDGEPRRPRGWRVLMRAKSSPRSAPRGNARNLDDL
jgi:hypothetical protein